MNNIKIVTDSSITIEPELVKELDITVVPLSVMIDGVLYSDNDLKDDGKFLNMMRQSKELPKTSQPPVGLFAEVYENLIKQGAEHIVSIHITHTLSGTVEAARQGANLSGADVTVIDSTFTDQCQKFQVVEAAKLAKQGADLGTVLA
jgi:DegV family protein with EDD domain